MVVRRAKILSLDMPEISGETASTRGSNGIVSSIISASPGAWMPVGDSAIVEV